MPSVRRLAFLLVGSALAGAIVLVLAYAWRPGVVYDTDHAPPLFIHGVHDVERDGQGTFVWTTGRVAAELSGLDRRVSWACTLRFRGPRPAGLAQPSVSVRVAGIEITRVPATDDYRDLAFTLPDDRAVSDADLVFQIEPTFTPGPQDTRELGVQITRLGCRPSGFVRPPFRAVAGAAAASALLGLTAAVAGLSPTFALVFVLTAVVGHTLMLQMRGAAYTPFPLALASLAGIPLAAAVISRIVERVRGAPFSPAARGVVVVSALALFLKLIGLMHPAKPIIDGLFHAHRLEWVMAGDYFFTQLMPNGVRFPYAIGLYVFAMPWASFVTDHLALIRTVAASADVLAGALLYPMIVRTWGDPRGGVLAVLAFQLLPLPFGVLGNENLTNLFGQSVALAAMALAIAWPTELRRYWSLALFTLVVTWAFCSHVSTVTTLSATLAGLAILFYWRGDTPRRRSALGIVVATAAALALAWMIYYRHFIEVYRMAYVRVFGGAEAGATAATEAVRGYVGVGGRLANLIEQVTTSFGWPVLILAAVGVWSLWRRRRWDRLTAALVAWAAVWLVFSASTVVARVEPAYVRYTLEFLSRINLATAPLVAILAACGAAAGWNDSLPSAWRRPWRELSTVLLIWAVVTGGLAWLKWFR